MKIYLRTWLFVGLCTLTTVCVRANDDDKPITPVHDPDINSPTYDGSTFQTVQSKNPTDAEVQAQKDTQQAESSWLIRGYEERKKMESVAKGETDSQDPFARLAANKDLAKLAGLTSSDSTNPTEITNLHAITDPNKDGPTIRLDPFQGSAQQKLSSLAGGALKPLISPLSATEVAGLPNFYSTLPAGSPSALPSNGSIPGIVPPRTDPSSVTEMPGLTAAQNHFTLGNLNYDLTLEQLPDDFPDKQASGPGNKNSNTLPQLPSADAAKQLQQKVQIAINGKITPTPAPIKVVIPPDPELTPQPIAIPIIMAGRPQIQDPNNYFR